MAESIISWDEYFLGIAEAVSRKSKDPGTKVGGLIVNHERRITGLGYNGFPSRIADDNRLLDRDTKLRYVIHAEVNAVLNASETKGCTLYVWPFPCCFDCAKFVIQAGITRVVSPRIDDLKYDRWRESLALGREMFKEAGVIVDAI
jgi:dCMP deaminase